MTLSEARDRDRSDPLAFARERFKLPPGKIYLDGNSLGALPVGTAARLGETVRHQWGEDLIASWTKHGWIEAAQRTAAKLSPIVGAAPDQLIVADSTSVSLFKLLSAAVRARPGRPVILTEDGNFPTDLYVAEGLAETLGLELRRVAADSIAQSIDEQVAVVTLTHVDYRTSARHDMAAINAAAHRAGALTLWDLSHSAGAIALDLDSDRCDLAVGCGYKYLNGGPGAPAFLYVARALQDELRPALQGWMGHQDPFAFEETFRPVGGMARFLTGTPSILAIAALDCGLDTFEGIAMAAVEAKGQALARTFIETVEERCGTAVRLTGPSEMERRGSHVSLAHPGGYAIMQALIARGVVGDFRAPDLMRFGFAPLYNRFEEVVRAAQALAEVIDSGEWDQPRFRDRAKVT